MGWCDGLTAAPTAGRSWSSGVWTCIPGPRTVVLLWGRTAWLWPPHPASVHPGPAPALCRRRVHRAWHGGTPEGETAQRNRPSDPTSARSEQNHLRKSSRSQLQQTQQRFAFWNPAALPWDSMVSARSRCSRSSMPMSSRFCPECQKSSATSLIVAPPMLLWRQQPRQETRWKIGWLSFS